MSVTQIRVFQDAALPVNRQVVQLHYPHSRMPQSNEQLNDNVRYRNLLVCLSVIHDFYIVRVDGSPENQGQKSFKIVVILINYNVDIPSFFSIMLHQLFKQYLLYLDFYPGSVFAVSLRCFPLAASSYAWIVLTPIHIMRVFFFRFNW